MRVPAHRVAAEVSPLVLAWVRRSVPVDTTRLLATVTAATGNTSCPRPVVPPIHRSHCISSSSCDCSVAQLSHSAIGCAKGQPDSARRPNRPHSFPRSQPDSPCRAAYHRRDWILYILDHHIPFYPSNASTSLAIKHYSCGSLSIISHRICSHYLAGDRPQHCQAWFTSLRYSSSTLSQRRARLGTQTCQIHCHYCSSHALISERLVWRCSSFEIRRVIVVRRDIPRVVSVNHAHTSSATPRTAESTRPLVKS